MVILTILNIAMTISSIRTSGITKELCKVNQSMEKATACKEVVDALHSDGKISDIYHKDGIEWCHDRFERMD